MARYLALAVGVALALVASDATPATGQSGALARLLNQAEDVARVVCSLRGLALRRPLKKAVVSRSQVRRYLLSRINAEYSAGELQDEGALLKHFGIIPQKTDYRRYVLNYLTAQLAGYYDPENATLYIADWIPVEVQAPVLAHEILHALQDQHFGLKSFIKRKKGELDATLAKMALVEGEGMALMYMYSYRRLKRSLPDLAPLITPSLPSIYASVKHITPGVSDYLIRLHLFSYVYGCRFVLYMVRKFGWPGVNRVYSRLPATTEQLMHPEKYLANERGRVVNVVRPAAWSALWRPILRNIQGEYGLQLLLRTRLPEAIARAAAQGWNGDQLVLLRHARTGALALLMETHWDTARDAEEFAHAYALFLRARLPGCRVSRKRGAVMLVAVDGKRYRMVRLGRTVRVLENDPVAATK